MNDLQLTVLVIGLVALARRIIPKVDGALVSVAAVALAMVCAVLAAPSDLAGSLSRGVVGGLSAFGAMTAVHYAARKLACLCKDTSDEPTQAVASEEV